MRIILPERSSMVASALKQQSSSKWTGVLVGSYSTAHVPSPHQPAVFFHDAFIAHTVSPVSGEVVATKLPVAWVWKPESSIKKKVSFF